MPADRRCGLLPSCAGEGDRGWGRWSRNSSAGRRLPGLRRTGCAPGSRSFRGSWPGRKSRSRGWSITREEVTRVLEEPPAADAARQEGGPGGKPGPASPIGAVTVPPWQEGAEASVLPQAYQDLLEVAADAGRPLRAGGVRGRDRAGHGQGEGRGPAVEAEAAGRAGLAGRGARRPVHPAGSRRGNIEARTVRGSSS